ncbi:MAG: hypothetical protein NZM37_11675 [Sandaracinaceae bacterium]|nr:hypothetical protein [Sandaracinaceae bacterium]MDW8247097.1 sigma factor [Sandaracinaceae bacterium]
MDSVERRWLEQAKRGDKEAFGNLARLYYRRLWALAFRMLGDRAQADDVVQETLLSAFRGLASFDGRSNYRPGCIAFV